MSEKTTLLPEKSIKLNSVEIEILLLDVHNHLDQLLAYLERQQKFLSANPETWVRLRIHTLRTLVHKLEYSSETREIDG